MTEVVDIKEADIRRGSDETKKLRCALYKAVNNAAADMSDDLAGFSVIVWSKRGEAYMAVNTGHRNNPIALPYLPTYAFSQLQRYVQLEDKSCGNKVEDLT